MSNNTPRRQPGDLLPLSEPVLQILMSLQKGDAHGYGIIRGIDESTAGKLVLSTSTLYGALQRMLRDELIERSAARPAAENDDERRRYYSITGFGREVLRAEAQRIDDLAGMLRRQSLLPKRSR